MDADGVAGTVTPQAGAQCAHTAALLPVPSRAFHSAKGNAKSVLTECVISIPNHNTLMPLTHFKNSD
jgi:hypothetical protein